MLWRRRFMPGRKLFTKAGSACSPWLTQLYPWPGPCLALAKEASMDGTPDAEPRWLLPLILLGGLALALAGAEPFAGSWNDGSRLACVEALVDHGTFRIDDS